MGNPIKSEDDAFRWLVGIGVYLGLIGVASLLGSRIALGVFLIETVGLITVYVVRRRRRAAVSAETAEKS